MVSSFGEDMHEMFPGGLSFNLLPDMPWLLAMIEMHLCVVKVSIILFFSYIFLFIFIFLLFVELNIH